MSKYASGLRQRLSGGGSLQQTSEWFIKCMANEPKLQKANLTPLERAFWDDIVKSYMRWKRLHRSHGDGIIARYLRLAKRHRVN